MWHCSSVGTHSLARSLSHPHSNQPTHPPHKARTNVMAFCKARRLMSVILIAVALWSPTTAVIIKDDDVASQLPLREGLPQGRHHGAWAACEPAVCHEVQTQAEGLDKIKTLKNFVQETLLLLDTLVTTLDSELVQTGSSLRQFIGPRCPTSHSILDRVSKSDASPDQFNFNNRDGETHGNLEVDTTGSGDRELTQNQEQGHHHYQQERWNQQHQQHHQEQVHNQQQHQEGHDHFAEHGSGENIVGHSQQASSSGKSRQSHSASSGSKSLSSHQIHSNTYHDGHSSENVKGMTSGGTTSKSSRVEVLVGKSSGCRGVMKGESPHWVPGLDQWCEENCSQGYCPQTHCVCGAH